MTVAPDAKKIVGPAIGESGVVMNSGVITGEEYNPKLQGQGALKAYNEMRSNDATVNATLDIVKLPIQGADYDVDPASEDVRDVAAADLVKTCLFHLVEWPKFLEEALTYLDFGFCVFEMVFESRVIDGQERIALVDLQFMKQTSVQGWELKDGGYGVKQVVNGKDYYIPGAKLVRFTHKQEGANYQGRSVLRTAHKHWYIKDKLYRIDAVGHERQALGVVQIIKPKGAQEKDEKKVVKLVRNLRANESSYLMHPDGWTVQFMDMKAKSLKDIEPSINHHDRQISKNVLAQFLEIGAAGSSGTRSTSEDQSSLLDMARDNIAKKLVDVLQNTVVRTLVDLNFNDVEYPTLRVGKISDDNIPVISEAVAKFVDAGVLHPTPADENTTRKMIGWQALEAKVLDELFESDDATAGGIEASRRRTASELKSLRASIEKVLYDPERKAA